MSGVMSHISPFHISNRDQGCARLAVATACMRLTFGELRCIALTTTCESEPFIRGSLFPQPRPSPRFFWPFAISQAKPRQAARNVPEVIHGHA